MAVSEFTGRIIAIIHRNDDVEGKWVASYENVVFILEEIKSAVEFQKIYFQSEIRILQISSYQIIKPQLHFNITIFPFNFTHIFVKCSMIMCNFI